LQPSFVCGSCRLCPVPLGLSLERRSDSFFHPGDGERAVQFLGSVRVHIQVELSILVDHVPELFLDPFPFQFGNSLKCCETQGKMDLGVDLVDILATVSPAS